MSTEAPYIGSKISLISKAEIRYEGVLYAVDTKEATVTLAKVRSFGTENRPVTKHIPPRNETYEFIIFRGSDIKDLHVSEFPRPEEVPQDPAILSAQSMRPLTSASPSSAPLPIQQPLLPSPSAPHSRGPPLPIQSLPRPQVSHPQSPAPGHHGPPLLPHTGPPPTQPTYSPFPPPSMGGYNPFGVPSYFRPPLMVGPGGPPHPHPHPQHPHPHPPHQHQPPAPMPPMAVHALPPQSATPPKPITIGTPPTTSAATSTPPHEATVRPQASSTPHGALVNQPASIPLTRPAQNLLKGLLEAETEAPSPPSGPAPLPPPEQATTTIPLPLPPSTHPPPATTAASAPIPERKTEPPLSPPSSQPHQTREREKAAAPQRDRERADHPHPRGSARGGGSNRRRPYYSSAPPRGGGGYRGGYRGGRRDYSRGPPRGGANQYDKPVYRYDREFDFESANARFRKEDLEREFKQKLRVDDAGSKSGQADPPSITDVDDLDQNGEEEEELEEGGGGEDGEGVEYYDKTKSFFDNITHETRPSGGGRRPNWNEEKEMNTETFGVSSVYRGYRRAWGKGRGRGGREWRGGNRYYGNSRGQGQRWGYRGGRDGGREGGQEGGGGRRENYSRSGGSSSRGYQPRRRNYAPADK